MSIEEYIEELQAMYNFSKKEWENITRLKQSEEDIRPLISEEEALRQAVGYVLADRHTVGRREYYKSQFMK